MGLMKLGDDYEEALAKIDACEKAGGGGGEESIKVEEMLHSGDGFFLEANYEEGLSRLNNIIAKNEAAQRAAGETPLLSRLTLAQQPKGPVQAAAEAQPQVQATPQAGPGNFVGNLGRGTNEAEPKTTAQQLEGGTRVAAEVQTQTPAPTQSGLGNFVGNFGKGLNRTMLKITAQRQKGGAPVAAEGQPTPPQPQAGLGSFAGNVDREISKVVSKVTAMGNKDAGINRLARLSVQDQIAELERISIDLYGKKISGEKMTVIRNELSTLSESIKVEKPENMADFEKRLIELRDERLMEVLSLVGPQTA
jgi:hypothetical protein